MKWQEFQELLKGKVFLIGLSFIDKDEKLIDQYQTHGKLVELTNDGLFIIQRKDNSFFQMPYDKDSIEKADVGEYRERLTGEIIHNPDYIMTWQITIKQNENIDDIKSRGYIPSKI